MPLCQCGCKATVTNMFKPGHDSKLKSDLIKSVMAEGGDPEAHAELERRGWLRFLDKAIEARAKQALAPRVIRQKRVDDEVAHARERIQRIAHMKAAWAALREVGRSPEVQVTRHNWEHILDDPLDYEQGDEYR